MFAIDYKSRTPLYQQIVDNVERLGHAGLLPPGEQLPSVRALAVTLSINPNTIAKAYAELESKGVIYSRPGRGSFMAEDLEALYQAGQLQLRGEGRALARSARQLRFDKNGFLDLCDQCWEEAKPGPDEAREEKVGATHD